MLHEQKADDLSPEEREVVEGNEMGSDGRRSGNSWTSFSGLEKEASMKKVTKVKGILIKNNIPCL